jgi:transcriptional regulator with XRE-family HTH domain
MARKAISKTELGERLTKVRIAAGYEARNTLSAALGMHPETLGGYERGDTIPPPEFLTLYRRRFNVDLNWLIADDGPPPAGADHSIRMLDPDLMERLYVMAKSVAGELGTTLEPSKCAWYAATAYRELATIVLDLGDPDEVESVMPAVRFRVGKAMTSK